MPAYSLSALESMGITITITVIVSPSSPSHHQDHVLVHVMMFVAIGSRVVANNPVCMIQRDFFERGSPGGDCSTPKNLRTIASSKWN